MNDKYDAFKEPKSERCEVCEYFIVVVGAMGLVLFGIIGVML